MKEERVKKSLVMPQGFVVLSYLFSAFLVGVFLIARRRRVRSATESCSRIDDDAFYRQVVATHALPARPTLQRAAAVGVELARNCGGYIDIVLTQHITPRHGVKSVTAHDKIPQPPPTTSQSQFIANPPGGSLRIWISGTLRSPDAIRGDADDVRRVAFYRDWGCTVGFTGRARTKTTVVKVIVQVSAVSGVGSRPRVITAYPCELSRSSRDPPLPQKQFAL
jgi:hypothetical protein